MKKLISIIILTVFFSISSFSQQYVLLGWNDLGMHCSNMDFSKMAVLPPYNNIYAQLIKKQTGQLPQIVTAGFTVEYSIPGNTYSVGKTNFWTYAQTLFGLPSPLPNNIGLTGKGLSGLMDTAGFYFRAGGVPVTPYQDNNLVNESPFQMFHMVAKQNGTQVAFTDNVIPVSNEIGCVQSGCHSSEQSIKNAHENVTGYDPNAPTLCAKCHASNALGTTGDPEAKSFSFRMHDKHSFITPTNSITVCYKCHPGPNTQCLRDVMAMNSQLVCQNCHGTMSQVASSISGGRRPWLDEPKCGTCHGTNHSENPNKLYRESQGHGNLFCSSCHGSPHAIYPSREANDNQQSIRVQGHAGVISDCMVCHSTPPTGAGPHGYYYIGISPISSDVPVNFKLYQNYPNPFNPTTRIRFDIPAGIDRNEQVDLYVFDIQGKMVNKYLNVVDSPGTFEFSFDGSALASGVYIYKLTAGNYSDIRKMMLIK
jgi:hypothetical protein